MVKAKVDVWLKSAKGYCQHTLEEVQYVRSAKKLELVSLLYEAIEIIDKARKVLKEL